MYEEIIKELRDATGWKNASAHYSLMNRAADAIECLNSQIANEYNVHKAIHRNLSARIPRWIPVTERLPEKPKNYPHCELRECYFLVTLESTAVVSCGYDFENNRWREFFKVTHWMPLPKPPSVDTKEQP